MRVTCRHGHRRVFEARDVADLFASASAKAVSDFQEIRRNEDHHLVLLAGDERAGPNRFRHALGEGRRAVELRAAPGQRITRVRNQSSPGEMSTAATPASNFAIALVSLTVAARSLHPRRKTRSPSQVPSCS